MQKLNIDIYAEIKESTRTLTRKCRNQESTNILIRRRRNL